MNKFLLPFFIAIALLTGACSKKSDPTPTAAPTPVAAFTPSRLVAEANEPITLTNTSTNATRYEWRSSDNPTAVITTTNPVYVGTTTGNISITLTAFNSENKSSTSTVLVRIGVRRLSEIRITALNFLNPTGGGWNSSGGPNVYVLFGAAGATPTRTQTISNVQQARLPLTWTPTPGSLPVLTLGNFSFTVKNENAILSDDTMFTGQVSMAQPSLNRDALGNGSYVAASTDGKWNVIFSYQTN